ncbi:hypothetical protein H1R20_g9322, partial [Candolleomyces eurysporus]
MKDIYTESGSHNSKEYKAFVRVTVGLWETATEEQKEAVHAFIAAAKDAKAVDQPDPQTPSDYQKYWEKLLAILSKTVTAPVQKAGVLAFVTLVGPVPEAGGQILATTLQFGDKEDTPLFSNVWADHDHVFVDQLANFLWKIAPNDPSYQHRKSKWPWKTVVRQKRPPSQRRLMAWEHCLARTLQLDGDTSSSSSTNPLASKTVAAPSSLLTPSSEAMNSDLPVLTGPQMIANGAFDFLKFNPGDFEVSNFWPNGEPDWANVEVLESMMHEEPALLLLTTTTTFPKLAASAYASVFIPDQTSRFITLAVPAATAPNGNGPHAHHAPLSNLAVFPPTPAIPAMTSPATHTSLLNAAGSVPVNAHPAGLPQSL